MDNVRWDHLQELFHQASELPEAARVGFISRACAGDDELLRRLKAMLQADKQSTPIFCRDLPDLVLEDSPHLPDGAFGPYRIIQFLGEGGMGTVYLAQRDDIQSLVAIKLLRDGLLSPERRQRFIREQRTLAKLAHPLIASIHDADTLEDGTPWFAMEYVQGEPITEYCRSANSSIKDRLLLFRDACEAVQYAHSRAVIHRDLKPSNIFVKADGSVKLLDFGIAKQVQDIGTDSATNHTVVHAMTLAYASPEQIRGDVPRTQADVYSLGVILYELLTGRLPFEFAGKSRIDSERLILESEPEPPSCRVRDPAAGTNMHRHGDKLSRESWHDLDVLALTALHKDTSRRYASVEALIRDVNHFLKDEPLEARPDSLRYRWSKFATRHRRPLLAAAAVSGIFVALTVLFIVRLASERTVAVAQTMRTQRIERFMLGLFDGEDKAAGPSDGLRVITLLDRVRQNRPSLDNEPAVEADLDQTLGGIYQKLGKFDQAATLMESALERRKAVDGGDSADMADSMVALGLLRLDQGRATEADHLTRDGLAMSQRHLPPQHPAVLNARYAVGRALEDAGAYDRAADVLDGVVQDQKAQGVPSSDLAPSIRALADAHYYLGHLDVADALNKQALNLDLERFGDVHPSVATDLLNLGEVQHDLGHDAEAEKYYRRAMGIRNTWYGKENASTALSMAAVGQALLYQGRYDESAAILRDALNIQERVLGTNNPQVAMGLNVLGLLEIKRGHFEDAETDFVRMADINRIAYGDRHYLVGIALLNLGKVYLETRQFPRAETAYRGALDRFGESLPPNHPNTAIAHLQLGHTLLMEQRYRDAQDQLRVGQEMLLKQSEPDAARVENARKDLIAVNEALNPIGQNDNPSAVGAASSNVEGATSAR